MDTDRIELGVMRQPDVFDGVGDAQNEFGEQGAGAPVP